MLLFFYSQQQCSKFPFQSTLLCKVSLSINTPTSPSLDLALDLQSLSHKTCSVPPCSLIGNTHTHTHTISHSHTHQLNWVSILLVSCSWHMIWLLCLPLGHSRHSCRTACRSLPWCCQDRRCTATLVCKHLSWGSLSLTWPISSHHPPNTFPFCSSRSSTSPLAWEAPSLLTHTCFR